METTVARALQRDLDVSARLSHGAKLANTDVELSPDRASDGHPMRFAAKGWHGEVAAHENLIGRRYRLGKRCSGCFCVEWREPDQVEAPINGVCAFDQLAVGEIAAEGHVGNVAIIRKFSCSRGER